MVTVFIQQSSIKKNSRRLDHQSTQLSSETQHPNENPFQLKERVAYMSPEQTGRMNR